MKKILVAGSTGYLGSHLIKALIQHDVHFKAIARKRTKLVNLGVKKEQMIIAEATDPTSLKGTFEGLDMVISSLGITRQKDGLSYMDVDYQANMNLLNEAKAAGIQKFIYVSAIHGDKMRQLKIMEAKEKFVDALKDSGLDYIIIRPNGFFSDMKDFLEMAKTGKVYLFGRGEYKLNPIHGEDLANFILESLDSKENQIAIGGPDILTQKEIATLALKAFGKPEKIIHLPDWIRRATISVMRIFTSAKTYGPFEFFLTMMAQDNIAPRYGIHRLSTFFHQEADQISVMESTV